ncbi:hypothetical protein A3D09_00975 [Candidatus Collierbacteria bacterium RIFCSPHIGHO2_02_FULL_49_10]|uniref:Uncharacterized protein n=2 Tax=Candidatus Collieribacteriota TaxID=1752725 RepID=A0A1F5EUA5_9BACT|nr:MAG: hypothetical protein A3D09_00975 [Candidatus Collierbacteria bacterium RIFCSPHIGHO2_02_FULL_49_10]OGD71079.1 MAG: hypothetical protein A2703_01420 [Candidatus Collierbacteria bacterium RIFCSPHIGHO2_01_FULL_50_25]
MPKIERRERIKINLSPRNSFDLSMTTNRQKHGLAVVEPDNYGHDTPPAAQDLLRTVMIAHLVAPHFPRIIETNFGVEFSEFLTRFYDHYGYQPPKIKRSIEQVGISYAKPTEEKRNTVTTASAHSGGLDSVFRLIRFLERGEDIVAVHLRNLNAKGNFAEAAASQEQCRAWGIPYELVRLKNSSGNTGFEVMKTRDLLLALIVAISTHPRNVSKIVIEGGMSADPTGTQFSEYTGAWEMFNQLLADAGLSSQVEGIDPGDIETVGEILRLEKKLGLSILPLVQNCFSAPFQVGGNRKKWDRVTPILSKNSPEQWCGSCLKCRRMSLGRIYYRDDRLRKMPSREITAFVADTYDWMRKYPRPEMISQSFLDHLHALQDRV